MAASARWALRQTDDRPTTERTGKYFRAGEERAGRVAELFSRIAPRYDLINDLQSAGLHRIWKRRLVRLAEVPEGGSVLDLCCGTGDIARALARVYPRAGQIAGLDFAMPMLRIATERAMTQGLLEEGCARPASRTDRTTRAGIGRRAQDEEGAARGGRVQSGGSRIAFLQADALEIPVAGGSFDRVTIGYGLRNVADIVACIAEVRRVLKPGGRFLILEFGKPESVVFSRLYFAFLRAAVPLFGRLFFGDPDTYSYIHDSLVRFPSQRRVAEILEAGGFAQVKVRNILFGTMSIVVADL